MKPIQIVKFTDGVWTSEIGPSLMHPRFGQCGISSENNIYIVGGKGEAGILESMEVINMEQRTVSSSADWVSPHQRWGSTCLPYLDTMVLMGGMDSFFIPHSNVDMLDLSSMTWSQGPHLPWPQSGAAGVVTQGGPTLFSGFNGLGLDQRVATMDSEDHWTSWEQEMLSARISGASVAIPSDFMDICQY